MESSESIHFDEYMEGGIPATLLKGLGYSEGGDKMDLDEGSPNEIEGSCDEVDDDDDDEEEEKTSASGAMPVESSFKKSVATPVHVKPSLSKEFSPAQSRKHRSGRIAQKTIIKGNIVYERTETGEVIASLIKTGDVVPSPASSSSQNTPRQRPRKTQPSSPMEIELPFNCPINEDNVGDILDKSMFVTQNVRKLLISLKDDLRRQGGGPHVTPQLKPVHMKRRDEIAKQLTMVYVDYQDAIDKICNVAEALSEIPPPPPPQPVHVPQKSPVKKHPVDDYPVSAPKMKRPRQPVKEHSKGSKEQHPSDVSDDLWMSCEPGSDDELRSRAGVGQKQKKQTPGWKLHLRKMPK